MGLWTSLFGTPWQRRGPVAIYAPVLPHVLALCLRHRMGPRALLRVNPALTYGGATIDSKIERYRLFRDAAFAMPTIALPAGATPQDIAAALAEAAIDFPVVVKPDLGFMSRGIHRAEGLEALHGLLALGQGDYVVQPFIADQTEFSIFHYRLPGEARGRLLDVTERVLPRVVGDGWHSVEALIDRQPVWRHAAATVKARCPAALLASVPAPGEPCQLAISASGAQGALFVDRRDLISEPLNDYMDAQTRVPGFHLGKFDFKVPSETHLREGRDLQLMEVNGVSSELNYLFDLATSYRDARAAIREQFSILFEIAARNRTAPLPPLGDVVRRFRVVLSQDYA